jgi:hypothetical protein
MSTPTPQTPVQQVAHGFVDELEIKLKAVLGTLSSDVKGLLGKLRQQAHTDATTVGEQAGQDVADLKQTAANAVDAAQNPPAETPPVA